MTSLPPASHVRKERSVARDIGCPGGDLDEIDRAYQLSRQMGAPVGQVFAMRQSGMGWGQIREQLEVRPGDGGQPKEKPGKKDKGPRLRERP